MALITSAAIGLIACAPDDGAGPGDTTAQAPPATTGTVLPTPDGTADPTMAEPATPPSAPPPEAIDWSAPLIGGGSIDMRGFTNRAVMLWFWAPY
ncbi:MAG: hypothetical protein RIR49_1406 [Actinomycetota bacterium]|jgi:hypothetical protein